MKVIIGISLISLASLVLGDETCRDVDAGWKVCEESQTINRIAEENALFQSVLTLDLTKDTTIGENSFSTPKLELLYLQFPYLSKQNISAARSLSLRPNSFAGLAKLEHLNIENTYLNFTRGTTFAPLGALKGLELKRCRLSEVPTKLLESMPVLEELTLEDNEITALYPNDFAPLKHLKELDLSSNEIVAIAPGSFDGLSTLRVLDVSDNALPASPELFKGLRLLKELRLSKCFDHNGFQTNVFQEVPYLEKLQVGFNNITTLTPGMFDAVLSLRELSLYGNKIREVPKRVFERLRSLKEISLADNEIETITPGAFGFLDLDDLILSLNRRLTTISTETFRGLTVRRLSLAKCNIATIEPRAFNVTRVTRSLDLTENVLTEVGAEDFAGLWTKDLDLSQNRIGTIAPNAFKDTVMKRFGFYGNAIKRANRDQWGIKESVEIMM
ncbi:leucine-rich repeat-containing protein 15 [Diachasma alloeum]|uniref:leucine-rich repeat-containing protein 15 n=1 Tax=Diachasma alloeum TaxID=454923 RepID=UPI0007382896|nr:leucine-rich repeat-containing protein 15 [Diachasma alloeum]